MWPIVAGRRRRHQGPSRISPLALLAYQFPLHTERVGRLPAAVEAVFNTPSHHRVHHASQGGYLDRNFGGILIVWDRLFGTFAAEDDTSRATYGLTKNIDTHNPLRVVRMDTDGGSSATAGP